MNKMLNAQDIQQILQVGETKSYAIIRQLNEELEKKGFLVVRGKVSAAYFDERFFGNTTVKEKIN